jgi:hypothetical protein
MRKSDAEGSALFTFPVTHGNLAPTDPGAAALTLPQTPQTHMVARRDGLCGALNR